MREIDLIQLEEVMRHYPPEVNVTARRFQIGGLLLAAVAVLTVLVADLTRHDTMATARAPSDVAGQVVLAP